MFNFYSVICSSISCNMFFNLKNGYLKICFVFKICIRCPSNCAGCRVWAFITIWFVMNFQDYMNLVDDARFHP